MTAVGLALVSAFLFGAMSVGLKMGLARHSDVGLATVATVVGALLTTVVIAAGEVPARGVHAGVAWPFLLAGLLQPGIGQIFVTYAVRDAGAARASVVLGSAPLVSVTIALLFLGEPVQVALIAGAVLIVAGSVELARERGRPEHVLTIGLVFAVAGTICFATRDNVLRWLAGDTEVPPAVAAAAALFGGTLLILAVLGPRVRFSLRPALPFLGVGVIFGLSYVSLFEAYYRGRVTVVSPLIATEALWGVLLSLLFLRQTELVGRRVVAGAVLVVAGSALIGDSAERLERAVDVALVIEEVQREARRAETRGHDDARVVELGCDGFAVAAGIARGDDPRAMGVLARRQYLCPERLQPVGEARSEARSCASTRSTPRSRT